MSLSGVYSAQVVSVQPGTNRVKLLIPAIFGTMVSEWATPMTDAEPPAQGATVWAMFEAGDAESPLYLNPQANAHYHGATSPEPYAPEPHGHE